MPKKSSKDVRRNQKRKRTDCDLWLQKETSVVQVAMLNDDLDFLLRQLSRDLYLKIQAGRLRLYRSGHKDTSQQTLNTQPATPHETHRRLEILARILIFLGFLIPVSYFCVKIVYNFCHSF